MARLEDELEMRLIVFSGTDQLSESLRVGDLWIGFGLTNDEFVI
jgi:hypothetical protein